jgi:hypothetical protein
MTKVVDAEVLNLVKSELESLKKEVVAQKTLLNRLTHTETPVSSLLALNNQATSRRGLLKTLALGALGAGTVGVALAEGSNNTAHAQTVEGTEAFVAPAPTTPGLYYQSFAGIDFLPETDTQAYDKTTGLGGIQKSADSTNVFIAHLDLPEGAIIEEVVWYFVKPVGNDFTFRLTRYNYPDQSFVNLFSNTTSALSGSTNVQSFVTTPQTGVTVAQKTVKNAEFNYNLIAQVPYNFGQTYILQGARVGYSMPYGSGTYFLTTPIRVAATVNSGGTLPVLTSSGSPNNVDSTAQVIQITGVTVGGQSVPAGAKGIIGSLTSVGASTSGNLRVYPDGTTPPNVNSLNIPLNVANNRGFNHTTSIIVGLSAAGKLKVAYNNAVAGSTCGFSVDVVGYIV